MLKSTLQRMGVTKKQASFVGLNNNQLGLTVSRSMPAARPATVGTSTPFRRGSQRGQQPQPRRMGRQRQQLIHLGDEQRRALADFEQQVARKFLQSARHYKYVQPLSKGEFSNLVARLIGGAGASGQIGGGLSRAEAEELLFAKYANDADGRVHYQSLAGFMKRGPSGADEGGEGRRNVWGGVVGNTAALALRSGGGGGVGGGSMGGGSTGGGGNDSGLRSLMSSGPVAEIFGEGFPVADICANWRSIRQAMKKCDRWNNGCLPQDEVRNILVMDFGIPISAAHMQTLSASFEGSTAGTLRYDRILKGCLQAKAGASQVLSKSR